MHYADFGHSMRWHLKLKEERLTASLIVWLVMNDPSRNFECYEGRTKHPFEALYCTPRKSFMKHSPSSIQEAFLSLPLGLFCFQ